MTDDEERRLRSRIEALEIERDALTCELDEVRREARTSRARVAELEGGRDALEAVVIRLESELAGARRDVSEGRAAAARLEAALREVAEAREELDRARAELERQRTEEPFTERVAAQVERLAASGGAGPAGGTPARVLRPPRRGSVGRMSELTSRRLRKLRRDPRQFFEDSKNPLARRIGRLLFS